MIIPLDRKNEIDTFLDEIEVNPESVNIFSQDNKYYLKDNDGEIDDLLTYLMIKYAGFSDIHFEWRKGSSNLRIRVNGILEFIANRITYPYLTAEIDGKTLKTNFLNKYLLYLEKSNFGQYSDKFEINLPYFGKYLIRVYIQEALFGCDCVIKLVKLQKNSDFSQNHILSINKQLDYSILVQFTESFEIQFPNNLTFPKSVYEKLFIYQRSMSRLIDHFNADIFFIKVPQRCRVNLVYTQAKEVNITVDLKITIHISVMKKFCKYVIEHFDRFSDPVFRPFLTHIIAQHLSENIDEITSSEQFSSYLPLIEMVKL